MIAPVAVDAAAVRLIGVQRRLLIVLPVALAACAPAAGRPIDGASPDAILARAVEQAGGAAALRRARALEWDGEATVHAGVRDIRIAGLWRVQPGELDWQDAWGTGVVEASGVRWPRELHLTLNGGPFFDLSVRALRVGDRLADTLLNGPGTSSAGH